MIVMLLILIFLVIWATSGDIQDALRNGSLSGGDKYNTVNNHYNDCDVKDEYNGEYEVNKYGD